jgi:hypothetical protein
MAFSCIIVVLKALKALKAQRRFFFCQRVRLKTSKAKYYVRFSARFFTPLIPPRGTPA